jgi:hypothetical protein
MITDTIKSAARAAFDSIAIPTYGTKNGYSAAPQEKFDSMMQPVAVKRAKPIKGKKYAHLSGSALRAYGKFRQTIDGKPMLKVPNSLLVVAGNSPIAMSYLLRRKLHPDRISTFKKIERARKLALEQAGKDFMLPKIAGVS